MIISPLNYTYALLTFGIIFTNDEIKYKAKKYKALLGNQLSNSQQNNKLNEIISHKLKSVRKY